MKVEVPVKSLCPCSKGISERGAHNQRSIVSVDIKGTEFVWIEDLVSQVEAQASAPLFALLKREDEKYVTELAYDQAKFAEDLARDSLNAVRQFSGLHQVTVIVENFESIHNHQAYAEVNWTADAPLTEKVQNEFNGFSTPTEPETFGTWLKTTREARNVSQSTLAKQLVVTPSYLSKIEADLRAPRRICLESWRVPWAFLAPLFLRAGRLSPLYINKQCEILNASSQTSYHRRTIVGAAHTCPVSTNQPKHHIGQKRSANAGTGVTKSSIVYID